jgi:hypothetical protein
LRGLGHRIALASTLQALRLRSLHGRPGSQTDGVGF